MKLKDLLQLAEGMSPQEKDNLQQELANKDINSVHKNGKVHVHPDDHKTAKQVAKRLGLEKHVEKDSKVNEAAERVELEVTGKNGTDYRIVDTARGYSIQYQKGKEWKEIDTYPSLARAKNVLHNELPGFNEAEELQEISKTTLGSYIKKASASAAGLATTAMHHQNTSRDWDKEEDKTAPGSKEEKHARKQSKEFSQYSFDATQKQIKRTKGIEKATDKLVKEDETLEEGDQKLLDLIKRHGLQSNKNATRIEDFQFTKKHEEEFDDIGYSLTWNSKGYFNVTSKQASADKDKKEKVVADRLAHGFNSSGTKRTSANVGGGHSVNGIKK